jgi:hypothetical protein
MRKAIPVITTVLLLIFAFVWALGMGVLMNGFTSAQASSAFTVYGVIVLVTVLGHFALAWLLIARPVRRTATGGAIIGVVLLILAGLAIMLLSGVALAIGSA